MVNRPSRSTLLGNIVPYAIGLYLGRTCGRMAIYLSTRYIIRRTSNPVSHSTLMRSTRPWKDLSDKSIRKGVWQMVNHDLQAVMRSTVLHLDPHNPLQLSTSNLQRKARFSASSYALLPPHILSRSAIQETYLRLNRPLRMHSGRRSILISHQSHASAMSVRRISFMRKSLLLYERWAFQMTREILRF